MILEILPTEIIVMILEYVDLKDLINFYQVSKLSNEIIKYSKWKKSFTKMGVPVELYTTLCNLDLLTEKSDFLNEKDIKFKIMCHIASIYFRRSVNLNIGIFGKAYDEKKILIKIIQDLYYATNKIRNKNIIRIEREDFIDYIGWSEMLLQGKIEKSFGGILVIEDIENLCDKNRRILLNILRLNLLSNSDKFSCIIINKGKPNSDNFIHCAYLNMIYKNFECIN